MALTPGTKLGPYEILERIGAGGMGEVWMARDTRLGRIVAIKKVKEQHSERFKQEARSVAALNHPNICQLHDVGPDYLVLEYVEGKPISGPMTEKEAVRLAIQIAGALDAAHKKGIIHRDLKPANIMVSEEGSVKVLDFGLAKLYEQSASESTAEFPATQVGAVVGTVAYMSPEQAQGQPADARSDIFSFGLVLYEMLSGRRAFSGNTPLVIGSALMKEEPPPLRSSPSLESIVHRCLAKQPSERFQAISEAKTALEQVSREMESKSSAEPQPSIAVLPFVNMSGDKEQEYFSEGLAEEIINALTQIPGLKVSGRTSSFFFHGKDVEFVEIGKRLNVENILEGSVRRARSRIRVTAQLIKAADGFHIWSERYDREMTDVFAIQDEIAQAIAEKLRVDLARGGPIVKRHTKNIEAYNLYLKGRYQLLRFTTESMAKSKGYYEQAIALDPDYALAWSGLADFYHRMGYMGSMLPEMANSKSTQAVLKALDLDEMLPEAHAIMAVLHAGTYKWKESEREFSRALELDSKSEEAMAYYSLFYLVPMGRLHEAIAISQQALEFNPLSPFLQSMLATLYFMAQQYDRAIEQSRNALELDPYHYQAHLVLGQSYIETGKLEEGIRAHETVVQQRAPSFSFGNLGWAYGRSGRIAEAQRILEQLQALAEKAYVLPSSVAKTYLGLGDIENALVWLERAIDERDGAIFMFWSGPVCDRLRSHPRYHALLRKMNLEA